MADTAHSDSTLLAATDGWDRNGADRYSLHLTREPAEIRAAQRLRHRVFATEMGAVVRGSPTGLETDRFDEFCDHLVVHSRRSDEIVGTYRMLPPRHALAAGRLYSDDEFDLTALAPLRPDLVETGRSCVHPDHRNGAVIGLIWAGIARYLLLYGHRWLAGCASVPLGDGGTTAAGVWQAVRRHHYASRAQRVWPYEPWPTRAVPAPARVRLPPLLRGYLRLGARVCGPPAHDPEFGVADFFVLLDSHEIDQRYLTRFLGES
ncbi:Putative hemolysin [Actinopolyspora xinjiangensis]|uniref:Putative hemolysin n=1 Tax=Actinopolyspora xinjiangensis TaxID=405564 RepID=A0A1H0UNU1_9ACTN|nr:GNAT family N-acyltransferase [Actinopolyspora xinjiangensis]SDP67750.1 Putative hemolysin [Actinopolyspora xinjiangensis]